MQVKKKLRQSTKAPMKRRSFACKDVEWQYMTIIASNLGISVSEYIRKQCCGERKAS